MAIEVNPPPLLKIPRKFLADPEITEFIKQQNTIIFQLWNRTGGNVDVVDGNAEGVAENAAAIIVNETNIAINADAINDNTDLININSGLIDEIPIYSGFMAQIQFLQRQFDGLPEFTIDTTGFTTDTTFITTDKVIA